MPQFKTKWRPKTVKDGNKGSDIITNSHNIRIPFEDLCGTTEQNPRYFQPSTSGFTPTNVFITSKL